MPDTKFCKNCTHFVLDTTLAESSPGAYGKCANPKSMSETKRAEYLVAGTYPLEFACTLRRDHGMCGPDGKMFAPA